MKTILHLLALLLLAACGSTQLVEEWKNPATATFSPNKVLVIGMTPNVKIRRSYESAVVASFEKEGIVAVPSVDFFESKFHSGKRKQKDLDAVETDLMEKGFDVVLITQLMSTQEKVTYLETHREPLMHSNFKEYYLHHQSIYNLSERSTYTIYHTHTSFYCLCPGKDRELLWSGGIDLSGPGDEHLIMNSFVKVLTKALKEEKLLQVD